MRRRQTVAFRRLTENIEVKEEDTGGLCVIVSGEWMCVPLC